MSELFSFKYTFNDNIGGWDVGNVTDMSHSASAFNQNIGLWDVSSVTNMNNMFNGADAFKQNLQSWPNNPSGGGFITDGAVTCRFY